MPEMSQTKLTHTTQDSGDSSEGNDKKYTQELKKKMKKSFTANFSSVQEQKNGEK